MLSRPVARAILSLRERSRHERADLTTGSSPLNFKASRRGVIEIPGTREEHAASQNERGFLFCYGITARGVSWLLRQGTQPRPLTLSKFHLSLASLIRLFLSSPLFSFIRSSLVFSCILPRIRHLALSVWCWYILRYSRHQDRETPLRARSFSHGAALHGVASGAKRKTVDERGREGGGDFVHNSARNPTGAGKPFEWHKVFLLCAFARSRLN